jgi:hypothetical protein
MLCCCSSVSHSQARTPTSPWVDHRCHVTLRPQPTTVTHRPNDRWRAAAIRISRDSKTQISHTFRRIARMLGRNPPPHRCVKTHLAATMSALVPQLPMSSAFVGLHPSRSTPHLAGRFRSSDPSLPTELRDVTSLTATEAAAHATHRLRLSDRCSQLLFV